MCHCQTCSCCLCRALANLFSTDCFSASRYSAACGYDGPAQTAQDGCGCARQDCARTGYGSCADGAFCSEAYYARQYALGGNDGCYYCCRCRRI